MTKPPPKAIHMEPSPPSPHLIYYTSPNQKSKPNHGCHTTRNSGIKLIGLTWNLHGKCIEKLNINIHRHMKIFNLQREDEMNITLVDGTSDESAWNRPPKWCNKWQLSTKTQEGSLYQFYYTFSYSLFI